MTGRSIGNGEPSFTILVVCSGNICRSPLAAQLLRTRLEIVERPFEVISAGTIADAGAPMDGAAADFSRRYGGDPDHHSATPLTAQLVAHGDLVLTAAREHRASVVSLLPSASKRTFTLAEFARLAAALDADDRAALDDAEALVESVAAMRGFAVPPVSPADDDIDDPYRRSLEVHAAVAERVDRIVDSVAEALQASQNEPRA